MNPTTTEQAAAEVIEAAGFRAMAEDVRQGKYGAARTLDYLLAGRMVSGEVREKLQRARQLLGPRKLDADEIRRKVEGRRNRR